MSQLVLDDQLKARQVLIPLRQWTTAQVLRELRPGQHVLDERVPAILLTLKQPAFVTIDQHFWKRSLCHPAYAILYFDLSDDHQELLPALLRALFRQPDFRTRARRTGKVARVRLTSVEWWHYQGTELQRLAWKGASRRK